MNMKKHMWILKDISGYESAKMDMKGYKLI